MLQPHALRELFPSLNRVVGNATVDNAVPVFFDAVGGTQVPFSVIDAISRHLIYHNGNKGGVFITSKETDRMMAETREIVADFINAPSSDEIIFGSNFTSLAFQMSRALAKTWKAGDEIIVSRLDHDANVSPWILAAQDAGVQVHHVDIWDHSCKLRMDQLEDLVSERTRLVAVCAASSSVGTLTDVREISRIAHNKGALVFVDAVAYAPHAPMDVQEWQCDFVGFSAYKFFGPHVAMLWGRRELLQHLPAYKIKPAPESMPDRWMNGAQPYELIAGLKAALEYLAYVGSLNRDYDHRFPNFTGRRLQLHSAMAAIADYESKLAWKFIEAIKAHGQFMLWGITDPKDRAWRVPVVAISLGHEPSNSIAEFLSQHGVYIWSRSVYSLSLSERLGLENTGGFIRMGLVHYNLEEEVDMLLKLLSQYASSVSRKESSSQKAA